MSPQVNPEAVLPHDSADGDQAIHTLTEWRVKQAAKLRHQLHQLRDTMEAAGELLRDGAAPPAVASD